MALLWFTVAAFIGSLILRRADKYGLALVCAIFLLALLRGLVPLDLHNSIIIRSEVIYPALRDLLVRQLYDGITVGHCLLALWAAGTLFRLMKLIRGLVRRTKLLQAASCGLPDARLVRLFGEVCGEYGYRGGFELAVSSKVSTARQAGFLHPYLLLSGDIRTFSEQDIRNVFRHELCHYLGGDLWIKTAMETAACFLWWNPVMPRLNRSIGQLLELLCDRRACRGMLPKEQLDYLSTLIRFMKCGPKESTDMALSYLGTAEENEIKQRFQLMLQGASSKRSRFKLWGSCILCALLFVASYCVILQPYTLPSILFEPDANATIGSDSTDAFILQMPDGTYEFYHNGKFQGILTDADLENEPYSNFQIYQTGK